MLLSIKCLNKSLLLGTKSSVEGFKLSKKILRYLGMFITLLFKEAFGNLLKNFFSFPISKCGLYDFM